ncbi:HET-domain-containing protein [Acephala macrosclerotiorum]|nr:HET-domain-containing protein [Acephala macrosclerotiorum]
MPRRTKRGWKKKTRSASATTRNETAALYRPLDSHGKEIRLVTLQQGRSSDAIHCNLSIVSLKEVPSYQALSYAWGDPTSTVQIYLDGRPHQATTNLESALRHLRLATASRVLWIDALCINQGDTLERNSQVMHMNGVYQKASEVVVWLGEEAENSNLVFDAFEILPKIESIHWDPVANPTFEKVLCDPKFALALGRIAQRSWWHRVWTVQESILGQKVEFVCGTRQISADTLFAVRRSYSKHTMSCCYDLVERFNHIRMIQDPMSMLEMLDIARSYQTTFKIDDLLAYYRSRRCTDPRDKIYGLLGIIQSEEVNLIVPDYSSPVPIVYEQVALKLIEHSRSLNIFSQICSRSMKTNGVTNAGLPSWVPNWTSEGSHIQFVALADRLRNIGHYSASAGTSAHVKLVAQGKIVLRGTLIGSCGLLSEPNDSENEYNYDLFKGWRDLVANKLGLLYANNISTTYDDVYWQTLCASIISRTSDSGSFQDVRISNDSLQRFRYDDWWISYRNGHKDLNSKHQITSEVKKVREILEFLGLVARSTKMRRLFISKEDGLLGLAPMDAEVGDRIALLEGGSVPYILRPKVGRGNEWELIGDAYVHGIMDGEVWKPDQLVDIVLV